MPVKNYHKLVRDRIPEIIKADGKTCVCETLSDEAYIRLLDQKLNEELAEYQESKSLEELADLLEQPHKISTITGTSKPVTTVRRSNGSKRLV